ETAAPEAFPNCCPERLAPINDEEVALMCIESTLNQIVEQLAADCGILRGAYPDAEWMFCATFVEPQGNYNRMLIDLDAVEHDDHQVHIRQVAAAPGLKAFRGHGDESTAGGALAGAMCPELVWELLHGTVVAACRYSEHELLDRALVERVVVGERLPRGQLHLPAVLAYAGTADNNTTTAHGQACVSASPTYWVPCGALGLDRAAQPLSVLLKHLVEGFQPLLYHELVQLVANDGCQSQRSLFRHVSLFAALLSSGILLHGGSFRWCLGPEIISGSNEDRHLCVQLRSTASGTSPEIVSNVNTRSGRPSPLNSPVPIGSVCQTKPVTVSVNSGGTNGSMNCKSLIT